MKKSLKFAIIPVLILLAGTAGALYYFLNVKEYDVADEKVEKITRTEYKVGLPDLDSLGDGTEVVPLENAPPRGDLLDTVDEPVSRPIRDVGRKEGELLLSPHQGELAHHTHHGRRQDPHGEAVPLSDKQRVH